MIELRTLGVLDLRDGNGNEIRSVLQQPKRLALLAYLALASPRRHHRRDSLLAMFWPELDEEHARAALRRSLYYLRTGLGRDVIVARGEDELTVSAEGLGAMPPRSPKRSRHRNWLGHWSSIAAICWRGSISPARLSLRTGSTGNVPGCGIGRPPLPGSWLSRARKQGMGGRQEVGPARLRASRRTMRIRSDACCSCSIAPAIAPGALRCLPRSSPGDSRWSTILTLPPRPAHWWRRFALALALGRRRPSDRRFRRAGSRPWPTHECWPSFPLPFRAPAASSTSRREWCISSPPHWTAVAEFRVVDPRALLAALDGEMSREIQLEQARSIAQELGAGILLLGTVLEAGGRLQINATLYGAAGELRARVQSQSHTEAELFEAVDHVARELLGSLSSGPALRSARLALRMTGSLDALKAYLEGERCLRVGRFFDAMELLQRAVQVDPGFALAYYHLAGAAAACALPDLPGRSPRRDTPFGADLPNMTACCSMPSVPGSRAR